LRIAFTQFFGLVEKLNHANHCLAKISVEIDKLSRTTLTSISVQIVSDNSNVVRKMRSGPKHRHSLDFLRLALYVR